MDEVIRYQDQWYVLAGSSRADDRTRVLKEGDTFGVFDRFGDIQAIGAGAQGLYHEGTRFLSRYELSVDGLRPLLLNSTIKQDNSLLTVDLTAQQPRSREAAIPEGTLHIFRSKLLWQGVQYEHLRVTNYGQESAVLRITFAFGADYSDIFEVRGAVRARRGAMLEERCWKDRVELGYAGLDRVTRKTIILFSPAPDRLTAGEAVFELAIPPHQGKELFVTVRCECDGARREGLTYNEALVLQGANHRSAEDKAARIASGNAQFNDWLRRSAADLQMLITEGAHGPFPYAGVPWFSTAFGRDGIITALQTLWFDPRIARGVLSFLAATQATEIDPAREAAPGKILHETRRGEMAALDEIPFRHYYGTIDATPLFVILADAYYRRTGDRDLVAALWPKIRLAIEWIDRYGDLDGDGFVEYQRHGMRGLVNQGWKDSNDSVFHADGRDAEGPIALCEVQAYACEAKRAGGRLARLLDEAPYADYLEHSAAELRRRFEQRFWDEALGTYVLALDGKKNPCRVRSSNAGHALFAGIAAPERASRVAETLLRNESFNGWGIRTLPAGERRYNPMSYHNGSVWPHDNGMIAMGFARYGLKREALQIFDALFKATLAFDLHRLPELFCGFDALPGQGPTLYPVACSPQAWASGTIFMLLQAALGLDFHPDKPQLRFHHPMLPRWLPQFEITNLRLGNGVVDLAFQRHARDVSINVTRKEGDVEVAVVL